MPQLLGRASSSILRSCLVQSLQKQFSLFRTLQNCNTHGRQTSTNAKSTNACKPYALCRLHSRSLMRLVGAETDDFLQGIITNDIRLLRGSVCEHPIRLPKTDNVLLPSLYSLCLNVQGRVLFDALLHRLHTPESDNAELVLEHDAAIASSVRNHLRMYKLRRSIDIDEEFRNRMHVWALVKQQPQEIQQIDNIIDGLAQNIADTLENAMIYRDPRPVHELGYRLLLPSSVDVTKLLQSNDKIVNCCELNTNELTYQRVLYENGVGEGCQDLLPGKSLPLECNADYLHGVSFEKGCYIGQELTARTFHTGVVRKRLMPIYFSSQACHQQLNDENSSIKVIVDSSVTTTVDETGGEKVLGKVRGAAGTNGIALLRVADALSATKIEVQLSDGKKHVIDVRRPTWWPKPKNVAVDTETNKQDLTANFIVD